MNKFILALVIVGLALAALWYWGGLNGAVTPEEGATTVQKSDLEMEVEALENIDVNADFQDVDSALETL